jgi:hypothetical protein
MHLLLLFLSAAAFFLQLIFASSAFFSASLLAAAADEAAAAAFFSSLFSVFHSPLFLISKAVLYQQLYFQEKSKVLILKHYQEVYIP